MGGRLTGSSGGPGKGAEFTLNYLSTAQPERGTDQPRLKMKSTVLKPTVASWSLTTTRASTPTSGTPPADRLQQRGCKETGGSAFDEDNRLPI